MSGQLLVSVLSTGALAPGASVALEHGLLSGGSPVAPTLVFPDRATPILVIAVTTTTVTFSNLGTNVETANFRCERGYQPEVDAQTVAPMLWQGSRSSGGGGSGLGYTNVERFTVVEGQTSFVLATPVAGGERSALVFLNGMARDPASDYFITGQILTFLFSPAAGAKVLIYYRAEGA